MRRSSIRRCLALVLAACGMTTNATAQFGLLFGGPPPEERTPPELDPDLPRGREYATRLKRPMDSEPGACSFRRPICVHRGEGVDPQVVVAWVSALETAYDEIVLGLGAPAPLGDGVRGGTPALDAYLSADATDVAVERDGAPAGPYESAPAFCVAPASAPVTRNATLCLAEAIGMRVDAAEGDSMRRALASYLWLATGDPKNEDAALVDDAQRHPERSVLRRDTTITPGGATLLLEYLDGVHGVAAPGALGLALLSLSRSTVAPAADRFDNEPDVADVLRATFGATPTSYARFWADFAVARAFIGSRGDGRLPALRWTSDFGRVRFDRVIALSSLPRNVAGRRALEPLGSAYFWVDLDQPTEGLTLGFRAQWEPPVAFKWTIVTVGADGKERARLDVPYLERGTEVERTIMNLEGARGLLIVGTNLGDLSLTYPFDPDFEPFEPHGFTVYVTKL